MAQLTHKDLYSLEEYSRIRPEFRAKVMAHKKNRQLPIGPNATLYFEDSLTMKYQIQEMLRIEKIFEADGKTDSFSMVDETAEVFYDAMVIQWQGSIQSHVNGHQWFAD